MKRRNLFIPDELWSALGGLAKRKGLTVSEHIRRAIAAYLRKELK